MGTRDLILDVIRAKGEVLFWEICAKALKFARQDESFDDEFADLKRVALGLGFTHVDSGPLVRSSYHAEQTAQAYDRAAIR